MVAIVIDVVRAFFAVLHTTDSASDGSLSVIVGTERFRVGQYGFQELDGHDFHAIVHNRVDACHTDVLNHTEVSEILLSEGHPEAGTLDAWIVLHERLQLFVIDEVGFTLTDFGIVKRLVDGMRFGFHPLPVFVVASLLRHLADVDFRIEVGGEGHAVVSGIAIYNIQIMDFIKVMLGGISRKDGGHTWVETASQHGHQSLFLESVLIRPLPAVLEVSFVLRLIVGGIEVVNSALQTSIHNRQVLIRKCDINYNVRLEGLHQCDKFLHVVGIHLCGLDACVTDSLCYLVTFRLGTTCQHDVCEYIVFGDFVCHYCSYSTGTDN